MVRTLIKSRISIEKSLTGSGNHEYFLIDDAALTLIKRRKELIEAAVHLDSIHFKLMPPHRRTHDLWQRYEQNASIKPASAFHST
jgi:hypothetical protein